MPEEADIDSLSDLEVRRPGTGEAYEEAGRLEDRDVFDANGQRVGRVNKCWIDEGKLVGCQVHLDHGLQRTLGVDDHVAEISSRWVADIGPDRIRLNKAAAQIVGRKPEAPPGTAREHRGSDTFPRKVR